MAQFRDNKQTAITALEQIATLAVGRGNADLARELREEQDHLRAGELNVVVCGECKRGKSSLINAFLEETDLCPPDAPVATNAITIIRRGEQERIVVHLRDPAGHTFAKEIGRADIRGFVTEQDNAGNLQRVQLVQIWLDNPRLEDGLAVFDTPGVGGLHVEHTAVTQGILPYADAVLFVCAADEPLSEPEASFCERIARHVRHLLVIVTKRDCVVNAEAILAANLEKLRARLRRTDLRGVAVSSKLKQAYVETGDPEDLERSGFAELERALWDLLAQSADILIGRAQDRALQAIAQLRIPLKAEFDALSSSSAEDLKALDDQLRAKIERAKELSSESPFWVNELNRRIANLQSECQRWLGDEFGELERSLDGYLNVDHYLNNPPALAEMLTVDCNTSFAAIARNIEDELGEIVATLRRSTALDDIKFDGTVNHSNVTLELRGGLGGPPESVVLTGSKLGRNVIAHSTGLSLTSGVAGGIIGGIIGSVIPGAGTLLGAQAGAAAGAALGGVFGAIFGIKRGITERAERAAAGQRQIVGALCRDQLSRARRSLSHELTKLLNNARSSIHSSLLRQIQSAQKACEDGAAALNRTRKQKHSDDIGRLRELETSLRLLLDLEHTMRFPGATPGAEPPRRATAGAAGE